jgi:FKBP-type peptidyl-prolyl cis-trans isomerase FklB
LRANFFYIKQFKNMKVKNLLFVVAGISLFFCVACSQNEKKSVVIKTTVDTVSYSIGRNFGEYIMQDLKGGGLDSVLNKDLLLRGFEDILKGSPEVIKKEQAQAAMQVYFGNLQKKKYEKSKQAGEQYLVNNKTAEGVVTTASGLQYKIIKAGNGPKPKATDKVKVHYQGNLIDGTVFDSSIKRGQPAEFPVNGVVPGWIEALQLMPVGSKWQLVIPYQLAYGERGNQGIPPYSTLIFEIELLDIVKDKK